MEKHGVVVAHFDLLAGGVGGLELGWAKLPNSMVFGLVAGKPKI